MKSITRMGKVAAVAALVVGATACAHGRAQQKAEAPKERTATTAQAPGVVSASLITARARVTRIDRENREITISGPQGRTLEVKAGPDVDVERLHVGDRVTVRYFDEVAMSIARATQGPPRMTFTEARRAGVTARQATVTARVVSVDPSADTVVIRGPTGGEHALKVQDPALKARLRDIRPGENFDVTYTQAVAVSIEPR